MKTRRWLTEEQAEAIEAAHNEEDAAIEAARQKRKAAVASVLAPLSRENLVAKKPHLKSKSLFRLTGVDGWTFENQGKVYLVVNFVHRGSAVDVRDIYVQESK